MEIPAEWSDVDGLPFEPNGEAIGPAVSASTNRVGGLGTPGVLFIASRIWAQTLDERGLLDQFDLKDVGCTRKERSTAYDDGVYTGTLDIHSACPGGLEYYVLAATPEDSSFIILVLIGIESEDLDTVDVIFASFQVLGDLP